MKYFEELWGGGPATFLKVHAEGGSVTIFF